MYMYSLCISLWLCLFILDSGCLTLPALKWKHFFGRLKRPTEFERMYIKIGCGQLLMYWLHYGA